MFRRNTKPNPQYLESMRVISIMYTPPVSRRLTVPCRIVCAGRVLKGFGPSLAKMGSRAFVSLWLLAVLFLVGLQHAVITAVPLRGPAGKTLKLTPGNVSSAIFTPKLELKLDHSKRSRVQCELEPSVSASD
jgi:hypothetical protein